MWVFRSFLFNVFTFRIGYAFLRIITFGKYPKEIVANTDKLKIEFVGIFVFLALVLPVFYILFK